MAASPSNSRRKEEDETMDLTLRLGMPNQAEPAEENKPDETSTTAADQPPSPPPPPPPIIYSFFNKEQGHTPASASGNDNFGQQFWQPHGGAVAVAGGVAIGPAAAIIPVVAVPFPQGFVPVYRSPRKRPNSGGEAGNEKRVCGNCGTRRTPLWRSGPEGQTSGTGADKPPPPSTSPPPMSSPSPSPSPPIMYNFFSKEQGHPPASASGNGNFHQQFWQLAEESLSGRQR
ncbi:CASP-like protein 4U1 [Andrographis paniculata]|uniref:CASP-like protein 4U1 n=1 Tax=Andrographis paniculata TaxID=175694 RepID=UPI0021E70C1A|nr:CASP-like protein 4U1 [Andrographis paniculata]